jgi:hypothetical protein
VHVRRDFFSDEGWFHLMGTLIILAYSFISFINVSIALCWALVSASVS